MRSVAEIENDLNAAKLRFARMDDPLYSSQSPAYRAARFDYILSGDRSGLDAQQRALEQAYQQAEQRKATEKMAQIQQGLADEDKDDEIIKELSSNRAILEDLQNNPNTKGTAKEKQQQALVNYWKKKADKRGLSVEGEDNPPPAGASQTATQTPAPTAQSAAASAPAAQPAAPTPEVVRSWKQVEADGRRLADSSSSIEELEGIRKEIEDYKGNDFTTKEANTVIASIDNRIKSIKDKDVSDKWSKKKDEVDAALKNKDTARLKELQGELEPFAEQTDYATTKQKVDAALKPKSVSPFPKWVKENITFDKAFNVWGRRGNDYNTKGKQSFNETVNGKSYTGWYKKRGDGGIDVTDDKGNVLKTFSAKALESGEENPDAPKPGPKKEPVIVVPKPTVPVSYDADGKPKLKRVIVDKNEVW